MATTDFSPKDRVLKNSRREVINLRGETGNPTQRTTPITVTTTAQAIVITGGKKTITLTNTGTVDCYFGDSAVTATNGEPIYAHGERKTFVNVKDDFIVYVITASDTTTLRVMEY